MKKWFLIAFVVSWSGPQSQIIVQCPGAQAFTDKQNVSYVSACVATQEKIIRSNELKPPHIFSTKKEAEKVKEGLEMLGALNVNVSELKEKGDSK